MTQNEKYPSQVLQDAVEAISSLPGVGSRSALRLALHLLRQPSGNIHQFARAVDRLADDVKTRFLNQMTEQMAQNVETVTALSDSLCEQSRELSKAELMKMKIQMLAYTDNVTLLLDQMLNKSSSTQTHTAS